MEEEIITRLNVEFPGRNTQIISLVRLFQDDIECTPKQNILLHGPPNTGKTSILTKFLKYTKKSYVIVDCMECYRPKLLYHKLLRGLTDNKKERDCKNIRDFVRFFKNTSISKQLDFMILKNGHRLTNALMEAFVNLPEHVSAYGWNFWLIFIDTKTFAYKWYMEHRIASIAFSRYNKENLYQIMRLSRRNYPEELFQHFLNIFLSYVYHSHRDIVEVSHLADIFFEKYRKPIDEQKIQASDVGTLFRNITHYFESNNHLFAFPCSVMSCGSKKSSVKFSFIIELPYKTKFLLLAAYVASTLHPKYDKRLFSKKSGKQKKKLKENVNENCSINRMSVGPKKFTINRLLSIFSALLGEYKIKLTAALLQQVTFLVELKLLIFFGNDDGNLDRPHYKCVVDHDTVVAVGKTVDCDIERYLIT